MWGSSGGWEVNGRGEGRDEWVFVVWEMGSGWGVGRCEHGWSGTDGLGAGVRSGSAGCLSVAICLHSWPSAGACVCMDACMRARLI